MALHQGMKYRVYIVRHVIVNANHFQEYFTRTAIPPALQVFTSVHCMHVLIAVSVPMAAPAAGVDVDVSGNDVISVHAMALPNQALSQGGDAADAEDAEPPKEPLIVMDNEEDAEEDGEQEETPAQERKISEITVGELEHDHDTLTL
jgi:hypothetical protein